MALLPTGIHARATRRYSITLAFQPLAKELECSPTILTGHLGVHKTTNPAQGIFLLHLDVKIHCETYAVSVRKSYKLKLAHDSVSVFLRKNSLSPLGEG